jgi:hypothetical protein
MIEGCQELQVWFMYQGSVATITGNPQDRTHALSLDLDNS